MNNRWERRAMREQASRRRMRKHGKDLGRVYESVLRKEVTKWPGGTTQTSAKRA